MYIEDILNNIRIFTLKEQHEDWERERKKVSALFEITPRCNFQCVHCYVGSDRKLSNALRFDDIVKILDILHKNGILFLTLSGGDPLARSDFKDIYLYAKKKGFMVDILTNATLLTQEIVDVFKEYPPVLVDISIYGTSNQTYEKITGVKNGFDLLLKGITLLKNGGIRFALKGILMQDNYKELKEMEEISTAYGAENFRYSSELVVDRQCSEAPKRYEVDALEGVLNEIANGCNNQLMKKRGALISDGLEVDDYRSDMVYRCGIGDLAVHINYSGEMGTCVECIDRKNVLEYDFDEICVDFEKYKLMKATPDYKCYDCKYKTYCSSCPQARKREYGSENIVKDKDCIVAILKYMYYVENLSIQDLKDYYKNNYRR